METKEELLREIRDLERKYPHLDTYVWSDTLENLRFILERLSHQVEREETQRLEQRLVDLCVLGLAALIQKYDIKLEWQYDELSKTWRLVCS